MKRWRWSRRTYRQAHSLCRLLSRYMDLPDHPPALVRRYWRLWEQYPQRDDPLRTPMRLRERYQLDDDIPF